MSLGKRLRKARKENTNLSISAAAKQLGISQPYLSNLENDLRSNPSLDILKAISELYKVPLVELTKEQPIDFTEKMNLSDEREGKIQVVVELLEKVDSNKFDKAFNIVKNILLEFIE